MGFLDKAKQAAEQAQKKLEETQTNFNKSQAEKAQQTGGSGGSVQYDEHGRPIQKEAPPAGAAPPPSAQPPVGAGAPAAPGTAPGPEPPAAAGPAEPAPEGEQATEPKKDEPLKEGVNQTPDPFKPIQ